MFLDPGAGHMGLLTLRKFIKPYAGSPRELLDLCQTSMRTYVKKILPSSEITPSRSMLKRFMCLCVLITAQFFPKRFFHCYINIIHRGKFSFHTVQTAVSAGPMLASPLYGLFCLLARPVLLSTCARLESLNPSQMLRLISG